MISSYKLSQTAKSDLIRIYQYGVIRFGERQAERYFNTLFEYFETISRNPYSFEAVDHIKSGYRRCACGSDSIYYRIRDHKVEIMTIIGQQDFMGN